MNRVMKQSFEDEDAFEKLETLGPPPSDDEDLMIPDLLHLKILVMRMTMIYHHQTCHRHFQEKKRRRRRKRKKS